MSTRVPPGGLAWNSTLRKYGAGLAIRESPAVSISSATPTQVLKNDPNRIFWVMMNLSAYYGVIAFNAQVTLTTGLIISGVGGYAASTVDEDGEAVTYPVWAIESVAGQTWYVLEVLQP